MSRTFLICDSAEHADLVDQLVFARLQDVDGAQGNSWSGVWTDGERFGILWASPVSDLFGVPEDFPELALVEETAESPWTSYEPSPDDTSES